VLLSQPLSVVGFSEFSHSSGKRMIRLAMRGTHRGTAVQALRSGRAEGRWEIRAGAFEFDRGADGRDATFNAYDVSRVLHPLFSL
jgi:hypothetical protein